VSSLSRSRFCYYGEEEGLVRRPGVQTHVRCNRPICRVNQTKGRGSVRRSNSRSDRNFVISLNSPMCLMCHKDNDERHPPFLGLPHVVSAAQLAPPTAQYQQHNSFLQWPWRRRRAPFLWYAIPSATKKSMSTCKSAANALRPAEQAGAHVRPSRRRKQRNKASICLNYKVSSLNMSKL
jgi:hypothetical protein